MARLIAQDPSTLNDWLRALAQRFEAAELVFGHGTDNAWDEAVSLTLGFLDWADDADLLERELTRAQLDGLNGLARLRIDERVPVPLLLGRARFAGLDFLVRPNVMIPRSPIAELIRNSFAPWLKIPPRRILDVCCGGGCIGLALADQFPQANVVLADSAADAVALAQDNVALHGVESRVSVVRGDLYEPVGDERFDLIVSNPPYVPSSESELRPAEFQHEPANAYDGGVSGMSLVARLLQGAAARLSPGGLLVIEVGQWRDVVEESWPALPFVWPELTAGGEGVLVLEAQVLAEHTAQLAPDPNQRIN